MVTQSQQGRCQRFRDGLAFIRQATHRAGNPMPLLAAFLLRLV